MKELSVCSRCGGKTPFPHLYDEKIYCTFCYKVVSFKLETKTIERKLSVMFPYRRKREVKK